VVTAAGRRAVLLVANPAAPYSRGLRVARSLAAAGWSVEIAATTGDDQPIQELDGAVVIRRYRPLGRWARFATGSAARTRRRPLDLVAGFLDAVLKAAAWPIHVRGWWSALDRELPPADLYHAFGILTIPVALRLARRARRGGRAGRVVYDVIDVILESNNVARLPGPLVTLYRARERRWVGRADAVITVNAPIADHLERIWALAAHPTVLLNCQPRWHLPARRPDLIRAATGLPPERRIVLFLGRIGRERGLDEAAEAVLQLRDAALVLLGFGPWADRSRERDNDSRFAGRHFTLPPVHPDDVPAWTASADATIIAVPANSLNQRLSTPNKFWESLAAGTPMVVGRELTVMASLVEAEAIGVVADPADPADLAAGLRRILEVPDSERIAMRERVLATAERYTWESAVVPYLERIATLVP
jgi:glycosyltransferase involved in cell wall biosynthesis